MATRPQFLPQLASLDVDLPETGDVNKLRPPLEIRETGYDFLQKIPAEEFNWLMNNFGSWIQYLDELTRDQGITEIATREQAEQGVSINTLMTPQRTLQSIQYNAVPPGVVYYTAAVTAPSGYLFADGSAVSRSTYSRLFDAVGTTFGAGDGSSTFNIPDLRDEFIRGANPGNREVGLAESDETRAHTHSGTTVSAGSHSHSLVTPTGTDDGGSNRIATALNSVGTKTLQGGTDTAGAHSHSFTTNSTGGSETRPQNVALLPIIKT